LLSPALLECVYGTPSDRCTARWTCGPTFVPVSPRPPRSADLFEVCVGVILERTAELFEFCVASSLVPGRQTDQRSYLFHLGCPALRTSSRSAAGSFLERTAELFEFCVASPLMPGWHADQRSYCFTSAAPHCGPLRGRRRDRAIELTLLVRSCVRVCVCVLCAWFALSV
jgi:hypothetical protein